ncbi:MAG: lysophospholipid acyltransferase family protein [Candidatus Eisenbacteria bacterium]
MPYRLCAWLAARLPHALSGVIARAIAFAFAWTHPSRRRAVRGNLARIRPDADARTLERLVTATYVAFAESLVDAWRDAPASVAIEGEERLRSALASGRGVVLWSAHLGNWELAAAALSRAGFPVAALARPHADPATDRFFAERRAAAGVHVVGRCPGARGARSVLRARGLLALLGDRRFEGRGRPVPFFGRPAWLPAAPLALARRTGSLVVPGFVVKVAPGRYRIQLEPALDGTVTGPGGDGVLADLAAALERHVRRDPTQWFVFEPMWDERAAEPA